MKLFEAIRSFTAALKEGHANPNLLNFDPSRMEFQVNVSPGEGRKVPGKGKVYEDDAGNSWWNIRSPKNADTQPEFNDYELKWPLALHATEIGLNGWNAKQRCSDWIGFDFDLATGHAPGVGVTAEQLETVREAAQALDYVEVRRSTSGNGLHFVVYLEGIATANHTEHTAVARAVLGKMSAATNFNFAANLDVCGQMLWVWARRQTARSFEVLKHATRTLSAADVPNWQDHIDVVRRKRAKVRICSLDEKQLSDFDQLASAHRVVPLDATHREHISELERLGFACNWDADRHLLQAHTAGFDKLNRRGIYQTTSEGTDPQTPNCFAFPCEHGGWKIYRFSPGVAEAKTWEQDGKGYTWCWFNREPNLKTAARSLGGRVMRNGCYELDSVEQAAEVAKLLGATVEVHDAVKHRKAIVGQTKAGALTIEVAKSDQDPPTLGEWNGSDKRKAWTLVVDAHSEPAEEVTLFDNRVRCLQDPFGKPAGWRIKCDDGTWKEATASSARTVLLSLGLSKPEAEIALGLAERHPWTLVSLPFHDEYPAPRQWNCGAPQWVYTPAEADGEHPTWNAFLEHLGQGLNEAVQADPWCRDNGVTTGADWWLLYYATILRNPFAKLPYLGLWGPQDSGKSSAYEVFNLLVTRGVVDGKNFFIGADMFNADFATAVLIYIDEHDLSKDRRSADKVKELTTALTISLRKMRTDQCQVRSSLHLMHLSNFADYFATTTGDCRAVIVQIPRPQVEIKKDEFHRRLKEEAPQFMRTVKQLRLPPAPSRMSLPILETESKRELMADREVLTGFLELCELDPDARTPKLDLLKACNAWLNARGERSVSQSRLSTFLANATRGAVSSDSRMLASEDPKRSRAYGGVRLKAA